MKKFIIATVVIFALALAGAYLYFYEGWGGDLFSKDGDVHTFTATEGRTILVDQGDGLTAVSYTHLAVYKRQAITRPGDEVIVIAPYFPEYKVWIETAECACVEVPAHVPDFQLDVEAIEAAITPKTSAVIINSPNNPVGAVYTRENLEAFADMLSRKEQELGRKLYEMCIRDRTWRVRDSATACEARCGMALRGGGRAIRAAQAAKGEA